MFAMFYDIYRFTSAQDRADVNRYCEETGSDWAMTFYDPDEWKKFEEWRKANARQENHVPPHDCLR